MPRNTFDMSLIYHDIEISAGVINIGFIKFQNPFEITESLEFFITYTEGASFEQIIKPFGLVEMNILVAKAEYARRKALLENNRDQFTLTRNGDYYIKNGSDLKASDAVLTDDPETNTVYFDILLTLKKAFLRVPFLFEAQHVYLNVPDNCFAEFKFYYSVHIVHDSLANVNYIVASLQENREFELFKNVLLELRIQFDDQTESQVLKYVSKNDLSKHNNHKHSVTCRVKYINKIRLFLCDPTVKEILSNGCAILYLHSS
jgi:hypothetical protein